MAFVECDVVAQLLITISQLLLLVSELLVIIRLANHS